MWVPPFVGSVCRNWLRRQCQMRIHRTSNIREQVKLADRLQAELIRLIGRKISTAKQRGADSLDWENLLTEIALTAESFRITFKSCSSQNTDRRASMLCGPFFTSTAYPIPMGKSGAMMPLVQLVLYQLSAAVQDPLGDGLLQLWCDTLSLEGVIRVIPRSKVLEEAMEPFIFEVPKLCFGDDDFDGFPLPSWFNLDPVGDSIDVIDACMPGPFESQLDCSDYGRFLNQILDKDLRNDLSKFEKIAKEKTIENLTFFGTYPVIQYSNSDTNAFCLLSISDWGSSGSAEIFYKLNPGGATEYTFFSCVR